MNYPRRPGLTLAKERTGPEVQSFWPAPPATPNPHSVVQIEPACSECTGQGAGAVRTQSFRTSQDAFSSWQLRAMGGPCKRVTPMHCVQRVTHFVSFHPHSTLSVTSERLSEAGSSQTKRLLSLECVRFCWVSRRMDVSADWWCIWRLKNTVVIKKTQILPWLGGSVGWSMVLYPKRYRTFWIGIGPCRFDSWSGHIPRLQVRSPVRAHMGGNQLMFLSHIDVSFSPVLSLKSINILK